MKVGNTIGGLEVTDVKRVNKLNLIQFLKEVDNYLQQGYKLDVQSGRQVGLVLQCDMFKTESSASVKVGSVGEKSVEPVQSQSEAVVEEAPVAPKKTTTRSKKTAQ